MGMGTGMGLGAGMPKGPGFLPGMVPGPNLKTVAFSRKNFRFLGKKRLQRVRLICSSSASTCAKSVFTVKSSTTCEPSSYSKGDRFVRRHETGCGCDKRDGYGSLK